MNKIKVLLAGALALTMLTGCKSTSAKSSIVTLDVNPSIQLEVDDNKKVTDVKGTNDDAKEILDDIELKGIDAKIAVNTVLGAMVQEGYLSDENNTILLSVENDDDDKREELEDYLGDEIQKTLKDYDIQGAILAQDLKMDEDINDLMKKYNISYGKAALIKEILDDTDRYDVEDLVKLNAQELVLIYQQLDDKTHKERYDMQGSVSTSKYISKDKALEIALQYTNLNKGQVSDIQIDFDSENGVLTYEVEFKLNNKAYEVEINANNGKIERDDITIKHNDDKPSTNSSNTTTPVTKPSTNTPSVTKPSITQTDDDDDQDSNSSTSTTDDDDIVVPSTPSTPSNDDADDNNQSTNTDNDDLDIDNDNDVDDDIDD